MTYPLNSRYANVAERTIITPDGDTISFLARRIIPDPARYTPLARHRTIDGDRVDQVSVGAYGDPLLYWRICDANAAEDTLAACEPVGTLLIAPLPLEMSGDG